MKESLSFFQRTDELSIAARLNDLIQEKVLRSRSVLSVKPLQSLRGFDLKSKEHPDPQRKSVDSEDVCCTLDHIGILVLPKDPLPLVVNPHCIHLESKAQRLSIQPAQDQSFNLLLRRSF